MISLQVTSSFSRYTKLPLPLAGRNQIAGLTRQNQTMKCASFWLTSVLYTSLQISLLQPMSKCILLFLLLMFSIVVQATHIVGGELNLQYSSRGYQYTLTLNLYFDDINGEREVEDEEI